MFFHGKNAVGVGVIVGVGVGVSGSGVVVGSGVGVSVGVLVGGGVVVTTGANVRIGKIFVSVSGVAKSAEIQPRCFVVGNAICHQFESAVRARSVTVMPSRKRPRTSASGLGATRTRKVPETMIVAGTLPSGWFASSV